ncbi:hypothetical protein JW921_03740 [Candidatus Fermentibacterales bacterium]|nr:hypothetical protein [Candidatus Fermentibacterales bacterium]
MLYGMIECGVKCHACDGLVPLNGPVLKATCSRCREYLEIPESFWKGILDDVRTALVEELDEGEGTRSTIFGEFNTSLLYGELRPYCLKCKTDLRLEDDLAPSGSYICAECGNSIPVEPPPDWLAGLCPSIRLVIGADSGERAFAGRTESRPVALSCPGCGGSLMVSGESDRLINCEYCGLGVYLTDDLWFRLHPVATKGRWFVGFSD